MINIELRLADISNIRLMLRKYDPEMDDIRSILTDVCRSIDHKAEFVMSGFGQSRWPVDIATDFVIFLEQLPVVLQAVEANKSAVIDFYEQGVQRTISLSFSANYYFLSCVSYTNWQPCPAIEKISSIDFQQMLLNVRDDFVRLVKRVAPELNQHLWFQAWLR